MKKSMLEVAHDMAKDLYDVDAIDMVTMKEYDALCLPKVNKLGPCEIKHIRLHQRVSQAIFAKYLNISISTVRQWEQGEKHPRGLTLKILNLIERKGLAALA